jgi:NADPH:quinone reductase-like Zn-dependent oxidoreductase
MTRRRLSPPPSMQALRIHAPGGPQGLVYEKAPTPRPGIGDALVHVSAASFTPTELDWPSTWVTRAGEARVPVIPAHELSGRVVALGYGTTGFDAGDRVYGLTDWYRDGAAAEYVAVEARNLAPVSTKLDDVEAAAVPMPALTAWQALFTHGELASGQTVLVLGASGGVGSFAVQLARAAGAEVVACAHAWSRNALLELGAERFLELDREPLALQSSVHLVVDFLGGKALADSWPLIRPGGRLVSVVEDPAVRPQARGDVRCSFFVVEPLGQELRALQPRIEAGELRPVAGDVRPLAEGREAFAAKQSGGVLGKSVLRVEA